MMDQWIINGCMNDEWMYEWKWIDKWWIIWYIN